MKARVARFYGWSDREINSMEAKEFWKYFNCISSIKSAELLDSFTVSSYPNLKQSKRQQVYESVKRNISSIIEVKAKKLANFDDTMSKLQGIFNGRR